MRKSHKDRIRAATARLPRRNGQGVLLPGGMLLTAAHCVCSTADGLMVLGDRVVELVQFGESEFKLTPSVVEAVCDIAVLGSLDHQDGAEEALRWDEWCNSADPVEINTDDFPISKPFPVFILTHDGDWIECDGVKYSSDAHVLTVEAPLQIGFGMSGGPVVTENGRLVGIISSRSVTGGACVAEVYLPHLCLPPRTLQLVIEAPVKSDPGRNFVFAAAERLRIVMGYSYDQ